MVIISKQEKTIFWISVTIKLVFFLMMLLVLGESGFYSVGDAQGYIVLADNLRLHGSFASSMSPTVLETINTPGYPFFLALLLTLTHSFKLIILFQILLVSISAVILYRLLEGYFSEDVRFYGALLYAIEPWNAFAANFILTEALFLFLFIFGLYILKGAWIKKSLSGFFVVGVLFSAATMVRPIILYLIPVLAIVIFFIYLPRKGFAISVASIFLAGSLLFVLPWTLRNYYHFNYFVFSNKGPVTLYITDAAQFLIYRDGLTANQAAEKLIEVAKADNSDSTYAAVVNNPKYASYLTNKAFGIMAESPLIAIKMEVLSLITFFGSDGYRLILQHFGVSSTPLPNITLLLFGGRFLDIFNYLWAGGIYSVSLIFGSIFWLSTTVLAFFAGLIAWFSEVKQETRWMIFISLFTIIYFPLLTGIAAQARYRVQITPFLFPLCLYSFFWIKNRFFARLG